MTETSRQQEHALKIQRGTREDLRNAYLAVHASAIVMDIPELAAALNIKRQYAKELMETLCAMEDADGNTLAHINAKVGEAGNDGAHDLYSTHYTVDDKSPEEMAAIFDNMVPVPTVEDLPANTKSSAPRTPRNATNPADLPLCLCDCGQPVANRKRNYKPGHDARHAGQVARAMAAMPNESDADKLAQDELMYTLPTGPLRFKAAQMADRLRAKAIVKAEASVKGIGKDIADTVKMSDIVAKVSKDFVKPVEFIQGEVKIGRWKYQAERNTTSGAVTYVKKGVREVATDKVAATFDPQVIAGDGSKSSLS